MYPSKRFHHGLTALAAGVVGYQWTGIEPVLVLALFGARWASDEATDMLSNPRRYA